MPSIISNGLGELAGGGGAGNPLVGNFNPAPGSAIQVLTPLSFSITDATAVFRRIIINAEFVPLQLLEVVHDGYAFGPMYRAPSNIRTATATGYDFTILRMGGWPGSPTIIPFAIDRTGEENP
jgi:hypothetical protein